MNKSFYGSICLSDIDKSLIRQASNGKKYLAIWINPKREIDKYGNTHYIKCATKPEQRIEGKKYYIGDLKEYQPIEKSEQIANTQQTEQFELQEEYNDLPF